MSHPIDGSQLQKSKMLQNKEKCIVYKPCVMHMHLSFCH